VFLGLGQRVAAGQLIGHVGMSGRTTGPHLHWGIRYRGEWLDPGRILRAMVRARRVAPRTAVSWQ
jgi:murein DD-endopeptidase MepM/ murein hydrolase activator NlpD